MTPFVARPRLPLIVAVGLSTVLFGGAVAAYLSLDEVIAIAVAGWFATTTCPPPASWCCLTCGWSLRSAAITWVTGCRMPT